MCWVAYNYLGQLKEIVIPEGARVIGEGVFKGDGVLEKVSLPSSLEVILDSAFEDCSVLRDVLVSTESRLNRIESKAFKNCFKLRRKIENGVAFVAEDAFEIDQVPETDHPTAKPDPTPKPDSKKETKIRFAHGKSKEVMTHDYGEVRVKLDSEADRQPMQVLTLAGEVLDLSLKGQNAAERQFTLSLGSRMGPEDTNPEEWFGKWIRGLKEETRDRYPRQMIWKFLGRGLQMFLLTAVAIAAMAGLVYWGSQMMTAFPEWVPENLVNPNAIAARFRELTTEAANPLRFVTPELAETRFWSGMIRWGIVLALTGWALASLYVKRAGKKEETALSDRAEQ